MRKVGDILKELGFNQEAPLETQKAFFRHLVAKAEPVANPNKFNLSLPFPAKNKKSESVTECSTQLSFDARILGFSAK